MRDTDEQAGQSAADQSAQNRDSQTVTEIRTAFAGDREERVSDARAQVARRINSESGRAAQSGPDGPHHGADQERD